VLREDAQAVMIMTNVLRIVKALDVICNNVANMKSVDTSVEFR